jgi:hypothetical protein
MRVILATQATVPKFWFLVQGIENIGDRESFFCPFLRHFCKNLKGSSVKIINLEHSLGGNN